MATSGIIAVNFLMFAYSVVRDPKALTGRQITVAHVELGLYKQPIAAHDEWYRLITSGFMHFGIIHIALNMYILFQLGQMIEPMIGRVRYLLVYLASMLGGSALALTLEGDKIAAGASGAVFGLMGFAAVGYYMRGINPLSTSIGSLLMMNLLLTFMFRGISIGGHIGGLIAGGLCAIIVAAPGHRSAPKWATYAAPIGVSALAIIMSVLVVG